MSEALSREAVEKKVDGMVEAAELIVDGAGDSVGQSGRGVVDPAHPAQREDDTGRHADEKKHGSA